MDIEVVGVGAAYEPYGANASVIVKESGYQLLVDCGPMVPPALWRRALEPNDIDAIYFTHCHPDHCLGLTTLINYWQHKKRSKELVIYAQRAQWARLKDLTFFGHWPDEFSCFRIQWQDSTLVETMGPWRARVALSHHSVTNLSLCLHGQQGLLFYSGDGRPSRHNRALLAEADVVFQECLFSEALSRWAYHGDWPDCLALARKAGSLLCPYHIDHHHQAEVRRLAGHHEDIFVPSDGSKIFLRKGQWEVSSAEEATSI